MITDAELLMSDNQDVLSSGDVASDSHIDTLKAADAIAPGAKVKANISTAYVDAGGGTIIAKFQTCAEDTFSSPTTLITGPTITIAAGAATAAGAVGVVLMDAVIPAGVLRYCRMLYTLNAAMDAGGIDASIVLDTDKLLDRGL